MLRSRRCRVLRQRATCRRWIAPRQYLGCVRRWGFRNRYGGRLRGTRQCERRDTVGMGEVMKLISIVSPCYNEEGNVGVLTDRVRELFAEMPQYRYEHIIIDNNSTDGTVAELREIAARDKNVKVIVNARNFGHIRSPQHALMEAQGDAVVVLLSDLQDPPEMIKDFLREWEAGWPIVVAIKTTSEESGLMYGIR